jgi:hypothetical protein
MCLGFARSGAFALRGEGQLQPMESGMTLLASFNRTGSLSREREENYGRDHSLKYLLAFGSLGLFVSMMAVALGLDGIAW